ncbi:MAG: hypothetical protein U0401_27185 [Anaerolineae bacterium]
MPVPLPPTPALPVTPTTPQQRLQNLHQSPKAASVTPNATSKTYGDPDPTFGSTLTGFYG